MLVGRRHQDLISITAMEQIRTRRTAGPSCQTSITDAGGRPAQAVLAFPRRKQPPARTGVTEEQSDYLRDLAEKEVPKDWGVWALADSRGLETGGGFYMLPPRSPQVIVQIDAVDQDQNFIEFIAFSPAQLGPTPKELFQGWIESFAPKRQVIRRPEQLSLWELEVKGDRGSMAQISKGV
ncbi:unnamed protein product [Prorocentrum cordatum]|uniref:Uncharacterized protein n=1 Tax=Prorocentrum cordatum TaxID=2364126 RepID=A0ABN9T3Y1_9DINO|nr:unnamed protein product [Polarella glacialis]